MTYYTMLNKTILLFSVLILFSCKKGKEPQPTPQSVLADTYLVEIAPINFNNYIKINDTIVNTVQGAMQFTCKSGDTIYTSVNTFGAFQLYSIKVDGLIKFQCTNQVTNYGFRL